MSATLIPNSVLASGAATGAAPSRRVIFGMAQRATGEVHNPLRHGTHGERSRDNRINIFGFVEAAVVKCRGWNLAACRRCGA